MHSFSSIEDYYTQGNIYERIISMLHELAEAAELQQGMRVPDEPA